MKYKKDYYGYVYEWTNKITGQKYIGSHYGSVDDYYIGSGIKFKLEYKQDPENFSMTVLEYITVNDKKLVLETEQKWLDSIPDIRNNPNYYNLNNYSVGGSSHITKEHIIKRSNTLKKKHAEQGLSESEKESYKQKIKTRLERISNTGFTEKEIAQHSKYGYQIQVTLPSGDIRIYSSCGKATKDLGIDVQYGLKVCLKRIDFKGYKIVKLNDPQIDCRKRNK